MGLKFEDGLGIVVDPGSDKPYAEIPTTRCVHCGSHFPTPSFGTDAASKKLRIGRGFCSNCNGYICGERCSVCKPLERMLEEMEGMVNPTAVSNTKRDPLAYTQSFMQGWLPSH
jgi:hypothetical protein